MTQSTKLPTPKFKKGERVWAEYSHKGEHVASVRKYTIAEVIEIPDSVGYTDKFNYVLAFGDQRVKRSESFLYRSFDDCFKRKNFRGEV